MAMMRKLYFIPLLVLLLPSCRQDIVSEVDFTVATDLENTYYAGEPVRFLFRRASVDNLLFYSGENGSRYEYRDRRIVPTEQVRSVSIDFEFLARYGVDGGFDVYISNSFEGLKGNDADADKAEIRSWEDAMDEDGNIPGWTRLPYEEGPNGVWTYQAFDLSDYIDNFAVAFHWHPRVQGSAAQRTYGVNGNIVLDVDGADPSVITLPELGIIPVMMNDEIEDPYMMNSKNGSICFDNSAAQVYFQGAAYQELDYQIDGWAVSVPCALNRIQNDKGTVIKTQENDIRCFDYVYGRPGTYVATFVGTNVNYLHRDYSVKNVKLFIIDKPHDCQ